MTMHQTKKQIFLSSIVLALVLFGAAGDLQAKTEASDTKTFALIVANNTSQNPNVEPLEYADDDGARYYELFQSVADETALLTTLDSDSQRVFPKLASQTRPPTRDQLFKSVDELRASIERAEEAGRDTELYLVFTGHGNVDDAGEGYLNLADSRLKRSELFREVVRPLDAGYTHLIIDACHAYFMVRSRGGDGSGDGWRDDRSGETLNRQLSAYLDGRGEQRRETMSTVGVIVSTAGTAEVHEWSRFRSGVFSHELRSGILGAADADGDGAITYPELEAYLVAANAAVSNPRARIEVYADPPAQDRSRAVVELGEYRNATTLEIPEGFGGRYHIEDPRGLRYADFHSDGANPTRLTLLHEPVDGPYYLRKNDAQAKIPMGQKHVASNELAFAEVQRQSRGSVEESYRNELFSTAFGPAFYEGYAAARRRPHASSSPSRAGRVDDAWSLDTEFVYQGSPGLDLPTPRTDLQHGGRLSLLFRYDQSWGIGPFVSYGLTSGASSVHRIGGGVEGSYQFQATEAFSIEPRLRVGHQAVFVSADQLNADPLGLRAESGLSLGWNLSDSLSLVAEGGVALDVVTRSRTSTSHEEVLWSPYGAFGVRF